MNVILGRSLTKRSETSWSRWKGFTLIELLTVIAIIGILASILIPVTARVRESTRRAVCGSNIRQQLMGMLMYAQDNDDSGYWEMVAASADNAPEGLYPNFVDDVDLFLCPSTKNVIDKQRVAAGITTQLRRPAPGGREDSSGGHSYEYFGYFTAGEMAGIRKAPNRIPEEYRTFTVLVVDNAPFAQNCPEPRMNHAEEGWNWGFADGHVEWVPRADTNDKFERSFHARSCPE